MNIQIFLCEMHSVLHVQLVFTTLLHVLYVDCILPSPSVQAIEKLKVLLDDGGVEYTEEELVIDNDGMVVGLSQQTFVSTV